ncbi:MAG: hypothetical protein QNJ64_13070 [Crocosphaera sp.]|nr:hypothetical protein [Crocosphaera sp.]
MRFAIRLSPAEFWIGNKEDLHREESYLCKAIKFGFLLSIIIPFFPDVIYPFSFFQFWNIYPDNWFDWWNSSKFLFAWGSGLTITYSIINYKNFSLIPMFRKPNNLNFSKVIVWTLVIIFGSTGLIMLKY